MALKDDQPARSSTRWWVGYGAIAVLIHLLVFPAFRDFFALLKPGTALPKRVDFISLAPVSPLLPAGLKVKREPPPPTPAPTSLVKPPEKRKEEVAKGQVVDLPPSADARPPDHADYLSEHNTRTERETRSRHASADYENVMNEPTRAHKGEVSTAQPRQNRTALQVGPDKPEKDKAKPSKEAPKAALEIPTVQQRDRLALRFDPSLGEFHNQAESQAVKGNSDRLKLAPGEQAEGASDSGTAPKKGLTMADLVPQVGVLARLNGGPANDALDKVEEGEGTFLNSREFKYAAFFNRLKRGVSQHWRPLGEYQRRDPTGNIYGYRSRVTILSVTLNADGSLQNIEVKRTSGVDFLDREAIAAFHRAEPFPNPPKGLIDTTGRITFPFGFHLDFGSHSSLEAPY